jgi:hypothetical protein
LCGLVIQNMGGHYFFCICREGVSEMHRSAYAGWLFGVEESS